MLYIIKIIANLLLPPSCFIILILFAFILLHKKRLFASKVIIITTLILFYISSIPLISDSLARSLEHQYKQKSYTDSDVIIMLGGGALADVPDVNGKGTLSPSGTARLLTAARIGKDTNLSIILSGGQVYSSSGNESEIAEHILLELGIPDNRIILENKSRNTEENAKFVSKILEEHHFKKPILVTSAFHMKRAIMNFERLGITDTIPFPTDYKTNIQSSININSFIPTGDALSETSLTLHEYLGIFQVWLKGLF